MHTGDVLLTMQDGKVKSLADVLHVLSTTKNLVFVGQMVEQGLQVRFTPARLYIEQGLQVRFMQIYAATKWSCRA